MNELLYMVEFEATKILYSYSTGHLTKYRKSDLGCIKISCFF